MPFIFNNKKSKTPIAPRLPALAMTKKPSRIQTFRAKIEACSKEDFSAAFVHVEVSGLKISVDFRDVENIYELKKLVSMKTGYFPARVCKAVSQDGRVLKNKLTLAENGLDRNSKIKLIVPSGEELFNETLDDDLVSCSVLQLMYTFLYNGKLINTSVKVESKNEAIWLEYHGYDFQAKSLNMDSGKMTSSVDESDKDLMNWIQ